MAMAFRPRPRLRPIPSSSYCVAHPQRCRYATVGAAIAPFDSTEHIQDAKPPAERYPPTQPPSFKAPDLRKSQLIRQYTSLLRSTPLTIFFQHNSLKANEWAAVRRELAIALRKVSSSSTATDSPDLADSIRLQIIQTSMFAVALRIAEFYDPSSASDTLQQGQHDTTEPVPATLQSRITPTHALSKAAHDATLASSALKFRQLSNAKYDNSLRAHTKKNTRVHRLLHGPIAALTFPAVTPQHLATALSILAPTPGPNSAFPAPRRKAAPGYYEPAVQNGLQKLLLLGARVDGRAMDGEGIRWIGGLAGQGGLEGLRAQLVQVLQSVGANVTGTLESAGKSLWVTMEGRRVSLEDGDKSEGS